MMLGGEGETWAMEPQGKGRYDTIRDYTLLTIGTFAFVVGVILAALGNAYGLGTMAAGGTALGLIPVLQRDHRDS